MIRRLTSDRGFLFAAVLTLGLGVGSVSAIFSVVNGVLLKPLPYTEPDRIVSIQRLQDGFSGPVSKPVFLDWQAATADVFEAMAGMVGASQVLAGEDRAERINVYQVTPEFWRVLGLGPGHGRYFNAVEDAAGERVVVIAYELWQRRLGGDPSIVGKDIRLDGETYRVIGITPEVFRYPAEADLFRPASLALSNAQRGNNSIQVIGRLREDFGIDQAASALELVNARLRAEFPADAGLSSRLIPLDERLNNPIRQPLLMLLGASFLVLLIACTNLGGLLLVRVSRRQHELALRSAVGADRRSLARLMLTDALVLALIGGLVGLALAAVGVPALLNLAPEVLPAHAQPGLDWPVTAFSLLLGLIVVVAFSVWPALQASRISPQHALQQFGRRVGTMRGQNRVRSGLVIVQIALSVILLVGAGLMIESLRRLGDIDPRVETERLLTANLAITTVEPEAGEDTISWYVRRQKETGVYLTALVDVLASIPGVESVALADALPLSGINNFNSEVTVVGQAPATEHRAPWGQWRFVNPEFFKVLDIAGLEGRAIEHTDWRAGEFPSTVVVNRTFVDRFLAGADAVGQQLTFFDDNPKRIVGVVEDTFLYGVDTDPVPEIYMHAGYMLQDQLQIAVQVIGNPVDFVNPLREALRNHDSSVAMFDIMPMTQLVDQGNRLRRFNMVLMSIFSVIALLLAVVGLYGVIAYVAAQRMHEFGVRLSLGATAASVLGLVMAQGAWLTTSGAALGVFGAILAGRAIETQLFEVNAIDINVLVMTAAILSIAALLACLVPAWKASRLAPMSVFRQG